MRHIVIAAFVCLLLPSAVNAQKEVTFDAPITKASIVKARVVLVHKERPPVAAAYRIVAEVALLDAAGNVVDVTRDEHVGTVAQTLIQQLGVADYSVKSEEQRIIEHMQNAAAHGGVAKIGPGTVTGTAQ